MKMMYHWVHALAQRSVRSMREKDDSIRIMFTAKMYMDFESLQLVYSQALVLSTIQNEFSTGPIVSHCVHLQSSVTV